MQRPAPCTDTLGQIDIPRHWCKGETKTFLFLPVGARAGAAFPGTYRKQMMGLGRSDPSARDGEDKDGDVAKCLA